MDEFVAAAAVFLIAAVVAFVLQATFILVLLLVGASIVALLPFFILGLIRGIRDELRRDSVNK